MNHNYAVIMAGGGGTRLWPISRMKHPKHILPLLGNSTLFQSTLERLEGLIPSDQIYVVTIEAQAKELKSQAPDIPAENFLIEPMPRGTASVVGLAATVLAKRDSEAVMLVLPSDHFIRTRELFHQLMDTAIEVACDNYLVTLGISPTFPATGYGYVQRGGILSRSFNFPVYKVRKFTEKPNEAKARNFLSRGDHSWNSGIFIWKAGNILQEFSRQMIDFRKSLDVIELAWGTNRQEEVLKSTWQLLKSDTIDYGIMEHAENVAVLLADGLKWSDLGSWDSLFDVLEPDLNGNVVVSADHMPLETHNSLVYSSAKKLVVTIGLDNLIIIDSGDTLLVCRRDQTQMVRQVISNLKENHQERYL
jgi:mannose-1-phosphate guanylyltransferase